MAADYTYDGAASVRGVALRATSLDAAGAPDSTAECPTYITGGFIRFSFTPEYSDGDEIEIKNAAGEVCVYYRLPDTLKQITFSLELCDPDPVLTQKLAGGVVLTEGGASPPDAPAIGYAAEETGMEAVPNGVGLEVWASAIANGRVAGTNPYWHYMFPYAQMRLSGERVLENGNLATVFEGRGLGNLAFGEGPTPDDPSGANFVWPFPQYADRAFAYARVPNAPVDLQGCYGLTV